MKGHPLLAATLDRAMAPLARFRPEVVAGAQGRVLEIGVGTGLNLELYPPGIELVGVEPDPFMRKRALARAPAGVDILEAGAEALPFGDGEFDTVVATFVLCTVPDLPAAMREVARVLRPGGRLLYVEHVRSERPWTAAVQRAVDPLWSRLLGGCHLVRDPVDLLDAAGLRALDSRRRGGAWTLTPLRLGTALRG